MKIDTKTTRFMVSSQFYDAALPIVVGSPPRLYAQLLTANVFKAADHHQQVAELTSRLIRLAEQAFTVRDWPQLEQTARMLFLVESPAAQSAALVYLAIVSNRRGNQGEARALLDLISPDAPQSITARALLTRGVIFEQENNLTEASCCYVEAARAARGANTFALTSSLFQLSSVKSSQGDHKQALADLHALLPIVRLAACEHPRWLPIYHNELAVELAALGRIDEARAHSRFAIASPFAPAYQEWRETAEGLKEPERVLVVVPEVKAEPKAQRRAKRVSILCYLRPYLSRHSQRQFLPAASKNLYPQPTPIIAQVKTRAPDRAPPTFLL
jgi:tetratricopeptide (TPR) repeat protein